MSLKIVLHNPEIPQNTGNIARLTAANNCELHLIKPLGFSLSDRYLKRSGLDYWEHVKLYVHNSWDEFLAVKEVTSKIWILTTKASSDYYSAKFGANDYLVFGNESSGLPEAIHTSYPETRIKIPMQNPAIRSLNLATSVGIVAYEAIRQNINR